MIDSHCHLNDEAYAGDFEETIARAKADGITAIVNTGANYEYNKKVLEQQKLHPDILRAVIGLSPHDAEKDDVARNLKLISDNAGKLVAIGEIGLEYHHFGEKAHREKQKQNFEAQLQLAEKLSLPVVIHCREAHADLFKILDGYKRQKVMMHCFFAPDHAEEALKRGYMLSVPTYMGKARDKVINFAPLTTLLCETDSPYFGGNKRNEPANVKEGYARIAKVKEISLEEAIRQVDENARKFFNLD